MANYVPSQKKNVATIFRAETTDSTMRDRQKPTDHRDFTTPLIIK